jgi:phosphatidylinositol alpha-1,6-mannosyltransferase
MLHRIGDGVDTVTYLGEYTRKRIGAALSPAARDRMVRLTPGVDTDVFQPDAGGQEIRERYALADRPVIVCVSRLMPRKGQDTLIKVLPEVQRQVPDAALLLVGDGPYRRKLQKMASTSSACRDIVFTGSVPRAQLPAHYAAGNVFAMPCRTRRMGLDVEGLGIVYLEASATGLPVIAGNSGGAPDAVLENVSGYVLDTEADPNDASIRLTTLLSSPKDTRHFGSQGRSWVNKCWSWETQLAMLRRQMLPVDEP